MYQSFPNGGGASGEFTDETVKLVCTDRLTPIAAAADIHSELVTSDLLISEAVAYLTAPAASGTFTVDILRNGLSIFSTPLTIDAGEETSLTAAVPSVIDKPHFLRGDEIVVSVTDEADGAASGLIIYLTGEQVSEDTQAPTVPADLALAVNEDNFIEVSYTPSTDNYEVAGYKIRVNSGSYTDEAIDIGLDNPFVFEYEGGADIYSIQIAAFDRAGNQSAWSSTEDIETEFVAFWNTVDAKHTETASNGLKVTTVGESGFSQIDALNIDSNGDYVEWTQPADGQWDFYTGRVIIGYRNGAGEGAYYESGATELLQTFTPAAGDVYRVEKIAGNNTKVYRNGVLIATTAYGDQSAWNFRAKSYPSVDLNTELAKPTVVNI